jgi:hypothetical protein
VSADLPEELERIVKQREEEVTFGVHDLGKDIDHESLPDDIFWVIGKTALGPVISLQEGTDPEVLLLPLREFRFQVQCGREDAITSLWWTTTRIRTYVAYFCQSPIPMSFRLLGKSLVVPQSAGKDPIKDVPGSLMSDFITRRVPYEELGKKLERMYDRAERYLNDIGTDSLLDRGIIQAGDAYWARDPADQFLQSWKGIEAIGDMDFHEARVAHERDLTKTMADYVEPSEIERKKIKSGSVPKLNRIKATVKRRIPDTPEKLVDGLASLRNAIAHGEVTGEKFRVILEKRDDVMRLSRGVIESALEELGSARSDVS